MSNPPDEHNLQPDELDASEPRVTGITTNIDLEKLFQEAEQTVNRIIHSKKEQREEKLHPAPAPEPLPSRELELRLAQLQEELDEEKRRYHRLELDFQNHRERTERQGQAVVTRANSEMLKNLLEILDTFEFARNTFASDKFGHTVDSYRKGFELLYRQLSAVLDKIGLSRIPTEGCAFDPNLHQAIDAEESENFPQPVILRELQAGFTYRDVLLRPAMVKVGVPPKRSTD